MNNFTQDVLFVLLIGVIASATDTDLATNTNILLLILLFLSGNSSCCNNNCCNNSCSCNNGFNLTSFFPG